MSSASDSASDRGLRGLVSYNIKRANSALRGQVERVLAGFGLRRTTFSALRVIADCRGLSLAELSASLAIEPPNMTRIVDDLQVAGLVTRTRMAADRRAFALHATKAGVALVTEASAALEALDGQMTRALTPEARAALIGILQEIESLGAAEMTEVDDVADLRAP